VDKAGIIAQTYKINEQMNLNKIIHDNIHVHAKVNSTQPSGLMFMEEVLRAKWEARLKYDNHNC